MEFWSRGAICARERIFRSLFKLHFLLVVFPGTDTVRQRIAHGRKAARVVLIVQSLWRLRRIAVEGDQQEWQDSFGKFNELTANCLKPDFDIVLFSSQPVGFVTFNTRAGAEAAKQDLQVSASSCRHPSLLQRPLFKNQTTFLVLFNSSSKPYLSSNQHFPEVVRRSSRLVRRKFFFYPHLRLVIKISHFMPPALDNTCRRHVCINVR